MADLYNTNAYIVHKERKRKRTCSDSVGLKLGRGGKFSGPFWRRPGLSVQCGFKDGLGGVQLFDQKWELVPEGGTLTVSDAVIVVIGLDDDDVDGEDEDEDEENDGDEGDNDDENGNENDDDDSDEGFCFVTNAGSVVTCQWEVCGMDPAALEWKANFKLSPMRNDAHRKTQTALK